MRVLREMQKGLPEKGAVMPAEHMKINREVPEFVISEDDLSVLLTLPAEVGMEILGASSDHTILDVQEAEDAGRLVKVGDVLDLRLNYASLVYVSASENVHVEYV